VAERAVLGKVRQVAAELVRDLGAPFPAAWRGLLDAHGPRQAARIFAKVLDYVEARGLAVVARTIEDALGGDEPLLLALAPPVPFVATVAHQELPQSLRTVEVATGCAADYDRWLTGGEA